MEGQRSSKPLYAGSSPVRGAKHMKQIKTTRGSGMTREIQDKLTELGIEFTVKYIPNDAPCQREVELLISPKTHMEWWAVWGVLRL